MLSPCLGESGGLAAFWQPTLSSLLPVTAESVNMMASQARHAQPRAQTQVGVGKSPASLTELWMSDFALCAPVNMHEASTRKEPHHLLTSENFLKQKSGTSVGYFTHYNLSKYPVAIFLPELLICGQTYDPSVGSCCKPCYNQHFGKCIITVTFFRSSSWWPWFLWGHGKEMSQ